MSDLIKALKKKIECPEVIGDHELTEYGRQRENDRLRPVLLAMVECVEASEKMKLIYEKSEREDFAKDQHEAWAARTDMFEALVRLKDAVSDSMGESK